MWFLRARLCAHMWTNACQRASSRGEPAGEQRGEEAACLEIIAWVCIVLGKIWSLGLWRPRQENWELPFVTSAEGPGAPSSARPPLCQLPQGGGYSGSEVSCFAQGQTAANRKGGVCQQSTAQGWGAAEGWGAGGFPRPASYPWPYWLSPSALRVGGALMWLRALGAHAWQQGNQPTALGTALGALG